MFQFGSQSGRKWAHSGARCICSHLHPHVHTRCASNSSSSSNRRSFARRCCSELEARFASDANAELSVIYRRTPETRQIVAIRAAIDDHYARTFRSSALTSLLSLSLYSPVCIGSLSLLVTDQ